MYDEMNGMQIERKNTKNEMKFPDGWCEYYKVHLKENNATFSFCF